MLLARYSIAIAAPLLLVTLPGVAHAQSTGLDDLRGARAGQAEGEIVRRGFRNTGGTQGDDRSYANWWNAARRQCVVVATMDGRYVSFQPTPAPDCGQPVGTRPRPDGGDQPPLYREDDRAMPGGGRPAYRPQGDRPTALPGGGGPVVDGRPVDLGLVCFGDGARAGIASGTTWTWNPDRERYEYGRYNETRTEVFDASLMVQVWDGGGRIRLPRSLIPPINSRGDNGWWALTDVSVGADMIRASYRLNGLNKPRVVIDRRSGRITVQGTASYGFRGTCDLIGDRPRRF